LTAQAAPAAGRQRLYGAVAALAMVAASALLAYRATSWPSDYPGDAGDPINALIHFRLHDFLEARPAMGPLSLIFRAPFAALAQLTQGPDPLRLYNDAYRFGIFPCLVAAGAFGLWLARLMRERNAPRIERFAVASLCVVSPSVLDALRLGHPEEILGATLACAGLVFGLRGHPWLALGLAGLTVANKQWGVLVVVPIALTMGRAQIRRGLALLAGVVAVLVIPLLAVDAASMWTSLKAMADIRGTFVLPPNVWFPLTEHTAGFDPGHNHLPAWLGIVARPLLVAICIAVPLLLARHARQDPLRRIPAVLALVLLLRCMLDPLDNSSYHVPFFMAVITMSALGGSLAPTLVATAAIWLTRRFGEISPAALSAWYIAWTVPFAVYLAGRAYGIDWAEWIRSRGARGRAAAPQAR
jgi:Glycosyltransferase family 87